jgi:formate dehydrogenase (coenzyme F420) beta subunit
MSFESQRKEIISICKNLLDEGKVSLILGFTEGQAGNSSSPFFIRSGDEADGLKWDDTCTTTLAKYLLEKKEGVAIVAKPCDARAIVMYMAENKIDRNKIYIIGVECCGMKDKNGMPAPGCENCKFNTPPIYDILVKNGVSRMTENVTAGTGKAEAVYSDKLKRFNKEIEKCILCFSCRQACYGCYCETCFIDRNVPNWLPKQPDIGAKMVYHLGRAMHLAGRCVECGACERTCPSGVNIRYLVKDLADFCKELYGYTPGENPDDIPAMTSFDQNDREIGFMGGEHDD